MSDHERIQRVAKSAKDAIQCWDGGACNPRAIARAIVRACDSGSDAMGGSLWTESTMERAPLGAPARILMAQLGWLLGSGIGDYPGVDDDLAVCRRLAETVGNVTATVSPEIAEAFGMTAIPGLLKIE